MQFVNVAKSPLKWWSFVIKDEYRTTSLRRIMLPSIISFVVHFFAAHTPTTGPDGASQTTLCVAESILAKFPIMIDAALRSATAATRI